MLGHKREKEECINKVNGSNDIIPKSKENNLKVFNGSILTETPKIDNPKTIISKISVLKNSVKNIPNTNCNKPIKENSNTIKDIESFKIHLNELKIKKTCKIHNKIKEYYCKTNDAVECEDCIIDKQLTNNLNFELLDKVIKQKEDFLINFNKIVFIKDRLMKHYSKMNDSKLKINNLDESLSMIKEKRLNEINMITSSLKGSLNYSLKNYKKEIDDLKDDYKNKSSKLNLLCQNFNDIINNKKEYKTIDNIILQLNQINFDLNEEYLLSDIQLEERISLTDFYIPIKGIQSFQFKWNQNFESMPTVICNLKWKFSFFPKGNEDSVQGYCSILLSLLDELPYISKFKVEFTLVHSNSNNNYHQSFAHFYQKGYEWGFLNFYKIDDLREKKFIDNNGNITINIKIKKVL